MEYISNSMYPHSLYPIYQAMQTTMVLVNQCQLCTGHKCMSLVLLWIIKSKTHRDRQPEEQLQWSEVPKNRCRQQSWGGKKAEKLKRNTKLKKPWRTQVHTKEIAGKSQRQEVESKTWYMRIYSDTITIPGHSAAVIGINRLQLQSAEMETRHPGELISHNMGCYDACGSVNITFPPIPVQAALTLKERLK